MSDELYRIRPLTWKSYTDPGPWHVGTAPGKTAQVFQPAQKPDPAATWAFQAYDFHSDPSNKAEPGALVEFFPGFATADAAKDAAEKWYRDRLILRFLEPAPEANYGPAGTIDRITGKFVPFPEAILDQLG